MNIDEEIRNFVKSNRKIQNLSSLELLSLILSFHRLLCEMDKLLIKKILEEASDKKVVKRP